MIKIPIEHGGYFKIRGRSGHALQNGFEESRRDAEFLKAEAFAYVAVAQRKHVGERRAVKDVLGDVERPPKTLIITENVLLFKPLFRCR